MKPGKHFNCARACGSDRYKLVHLEAAQHQGSGPNIRGAKILARVRVSRHVRGIKEFFQVMNETQIK